MSLKEMFKKTKYISLNNTSIKENDYNRYTQEEEDSQKSVDSCPSIPNGAWIKCDSCGKTLFCEDVVSNFNCCPNCNFHFRIGANKRIHMVVDEESFQELSRYKNTNNVLDFPGYDEKIRNLQLRTGMLEAVVIGEGRINNYPVVIACMDGAFLMGSMGQVVGEKITLAIEYALKKSLPLIIFSTSGGARMQEGIISLMQMAKTSAALKRHSDAGLLYISVLADPTTGGVTASFAMLGDIILAEPGALIGFAGPRVIEQTIRQKLPEGFQKAEFLLEKGFVDRIVKRENLKAELGTILSMH